MKPLQLFAQGPERSPPLEILPTRHFERRQSQYLIPPSSRNNGVMLTCDFDSGQGFGVGTGYHTTHRLQLLPDRRKSAFAVVVFRLEVGLPPDVVEDVFEVLHQRVADFSERLKERKSGIKEMKVCYTSEVADATASTVPPVEWAVVEAEARPPGVVLFALEDEEADADFPSSSLAPRLAKSASMAQTAVRQTYGYHRRHISDLKTNKLDCTTQRINTIRFICVLWLKVFQ